MSDWQRARRPEQKEERQAAILDAAARLYSEGAGSHLTIAAIATAAGLAKGSVYRYFSTREEVLLGVLSRELGAWFEVWNARLDAMGTSGTPEGVARSLVETLESKTLLTQLLASLTNELEHNLSLEAATQFKRAASALIQGTGEKLERVLPGLPTGGGPRIFLWLQAMITGLWAASHPEGSVCEVLSQEEFAPMQVRFLEELELMFAAVLRGMGGGKPTKGS